MTDVTGGLQVRGLTVRTAHRTILDDVTFTVPPGRRLGVIGASGSGKSMTSLALMGLEPAGTTVTGSIRLDGTELVGLPDRERAQHRGSGIAMVFQEPATALDPLRRVGAQIAEPLRLHRGLDRRAARTAATELATAVGLPDPSSLLRQYPHQLSAASGSASASPWPWPATRRSSSRTSPPPRSTSPPRRGCSTCSPASPRAWCSSRTTSRCSPGSPTPRSCWTPAGWSRRVRSADSSPPRGTPPPGTRRGRPCHRPPHRRTRMTDALRASGLHRTYRLPRRGPFEPGPLRTAVDGVDLTVAAGSRLASSASPAPASRHWSGCSPDWRHPAPDPCRPAVVRWSPPPPRARCAGSVARPGWCSRTRTPRSTPGCASGRSSPSPSGRSGSGVASRPGPRGAGARRPAGGRRGPLPARVLRWAAAAHRDRPRGGALARILFGDEPMSALDVVVRARVIDLFRSLADDLG